MTWIDIDFLFAIFAENRHFQDISSELYPSESHSILMKNTGIEKLPLYFLGHSQVIHEYYNPRRGKNYQYY